MGLIGVIDSGIGGLTILQQLLQSTSYNYVYIADHAFCPYGSKPNDIIFSRANKFVNYLKKQGAQAVVLACNTISVFADKLRQVHNIPIYNVIIPTCQRIVANPDVKRVALLATKSTIANGAYQDYLSQYGVEVATFDCSAFVPFVEQHSTTTLACAQTVKKVLNALPKTRSDAVILGCTHFPLLRRQIAYYCDDSKIVECGADLPDDINAAIAKNRTVKYLTTGDVDFANSAASCFSNVSFKHICLS